MIKLYKHGWHLETFSKGFKKWQEGWYLSEEAFPATKEQRDKLVELGWGEDETLSAQGANVVIQSIIEG
jgi:hypothetical protein